MARTASRGPQPLPVRLAHWANAPLLAIMMGSGLQILAAYPLLGPRGGAYRWYPFQGFAPMWPRIGGWLAGGRAWHFAFAWLLLGNGLAYLGYLVASGEWRRRLFWPPRDALNAARMAAYYLRLRRQPPPVAPRDLYNGLQRWAYTSALVLGALAVASGCAIYKPLQLGWLAAPFGGYDGARATHLIVLELLVAFTVGHVVMVLLHPRSLVEMVTGGKKR